MMKKRAYILTFIVIILSLIYMNQQTHFFSWKKIETQHILPKTEAELIFHPYYHQGSFLHSSTEMSLQKMKRNSYSIQLQTMSEASSSFTETHHITFLYKNGQLKEIIQKGIERSSVMNASSLFHGDKSARYNAITLHHASLEQEKNPLPTLTEDFEGVIFSTSVDQVYVLNSAVSASTLFREGLTNTQKQWQRILDHAIKEEQDYQWKHLISFFNIDHTSYEIIPFTHLANYESQTLPSLSKQDTKTIIGSIWRSIYSLLVQEDSEHILVEGSLQPLFLIAKDYTHFQILLRTEHGKEIIYTVPITTDLHE